MAIIAADYWLIISFARDYFRLDRSNREMYSRQAVAKVYFRDSLPQGCACFAGDHCARMRSNCQKHVNRSEMNAGTSPAHAPCEAEYRGPGSIAPLRSCTPSLRLRHPRWRAGVTPATSRRSMRLPHDRHRPRAPPGPHRARCRHRRKCVDGSIDAGATHPCR